MTLKPTIDKADSLDKLDIRLGQVNRMEHAVGPKPAYLLTIDFGKHGTKTSVGRFTSHSMDALLGAHVVAILNFPSRSVGEHLSEVLALGIQFPNATAGEASCLTPAVKGVTLGAKIF